MTTPPKATTNFDTAIETYSDDANDLYKAVHDAAVVAAPTPHASPTSDDVKNAQNLLQSAFTQLTTAASMEADQTDRAGLAAVVQLMQTTADSAATISARLIMVLNMHQPGTNPPAGYYE